MFIKRDLADLILAGASQSPVLAIVGPRQSGKSTLIKHLFPNYHYIDMQDAEALDFAQSDPKGFLHTHSQKTGLIIDEAQYAPALFSQIKVEVDKNPRPGFYILSGSQNFLLHEKISESLAGRVYFYTLLPFSIKELTAAQLRCENPIDQICKGFYPRIYQPGITAPDYYANYIATYVERDIRSIRNIENSTIFRKFMQLCALRTGTIINFTDLATQTGISLNTARGWLSLLETSFILFQLPPYHNNLGKRITKSPKIYFYDVALAAHLMGLDKDSIVERRDLYGALFENMVIVDIIKNLTYQTPRPTATFFRDTNKNEVDLILETAKTVMPIEIKASQTMSSKFFDTAHWFSTQTPHCAQPVVVYGGTATQERTEGLVVPWSELEKIFQK